MRKTPTLFQRDWTGDRSLVIDVANPDCAWVFAGEGIATRKIDGTSCMIRDGRLFKRRELKLPASLPDGFERTDYDPTTEKVMGWVPVGDGPEDRHHREAFKARTTWADGTYELIGPKVQGDPENAGIHILWAHDDLRFKDDVVVPRTFDGLREFFAADPTIEGIVFHHPNGSMAKIKLRDFGIKRVPVGKVI